MFGCVYKITCLVNGRVYVGATRSTVKKRWQSHCCHARIVLYQDYPLYVDIRRYGADKFKVSIIRWRRCKLQLLKSERFYILKFDSRVPNGYNARLGNKLTCKEKQVRSAQAKAWHERRTPEQRLSSISKGVATRRKNYVPGKLSESSRKAWETRRSVYTPEERRRSHSEGSRKAWVTIRKLYPPERISAWSRKKT